MKSKHTIAFIGGRGLFSSYGGVENATREIAKELSKREDVAVNVYSVEGENDEVFAYSDNLNVIAISRSIYKSLGQHGYILACVLHALFKLRPNAVFLFASGPCVFAPILRLGGIRVISSIRGMDSARDKWGRLSRNILKLGEYCAWKFSHQFTANSKKIVENFSKKRPDSHFIPNGCRAVTDADCASLDKYKVERNGYLLFAARLDPIKRLHLLLEVHRQLPNDQKLPLIIAGGNSNDLEYEAKLKQYENDEKVMFIGHISSSELAPLMKHCRAFILPSVIEGMSNSLLSAMANGKAIIAADIEENRDVVELDDALFEKDSFEQLQISVARVSTNADFCQQLGEKLAVLAHEKYSWENTAERFLELSRAG
ncbi:hypothetical protein BIY22_16410 [Vibrio panuliri]|uniref:Glycosyl transferase n=1 Tax=Vibrio panuliri TaxID=1381081 RepID=A0A1Q9HMW5_9VIBR|nr:glycosyltransferase family 4 protein [Vibrio panuliri]OLQ92092.1 hypothetical protein BIY22_16410 [Vibrio panuliri]